MAKSRIIPAIWGSKTFARPGTANWGPMTLARLEVPRWGSKILPRMPDLGLVDLGQVAGHAWRSGARWTLARSRVMPAIWGWWTLARSRVMPWRSRGWWTLARSRVMP